MLIRHNVRTGSKTPVHFAHDTDQVDLNGCWVSGRTDKVFTNERNRCPQCDGYGKLVAIQPLGRSEYPQGATVPDRYRKHHSPDAPAPSVPSEPPSVPSEPPTDAPAPSVPVQPVSASGGNAADVGQAIVDALAAGQREALDRAVTDLTAVFDEKVKNLSIPTRIEISRPDGTVKPITGTVHSKFQKCLRYLQARRHLYLTGPAGCGKTTLARQLAEALDVPFYTTGQVLANFDVLGFVDANGNYHSTAFRQAYEHGGLWLGDEIDAWSQEATLAANAALANGHATFPDSPSPIPAHPDFYVIAAGNTWGNGADREYVGRNEMDAASLSRFVTLAIDYDRSLEQALSGEFAEWRELVWRIRDNSRNLRVRIMAGTRELVHGVACLSTGMELSEIREDILKRDMDDTQWRKLTAAA